MAESFERIHRSNLIGMGVLPLQIRDGATLEDLGIDGESAGAATFTIRGIAGADPQSLLGASLDVEVTGPDGSGSTIPVTVRIDTPTEAAYYEHGGILPYVLRQHLSPPAAEAAVRACGVRPRPQRGGTSRRKARPRWLRACFSSSDISANVRPSPSVGCMTGS